MTEIDVAVIGAGAAGLAAGLTLQKSGRSFIVLEARNRIGGRAFTDISTLPGIPFDVGGHWLHAAKQNPFTAIADRLGFRYNAAIDWSHRVMLTGGGGTAERSALDSSSASLMRVLDCIEDAGRDGRDVAYTEVIDTSDPWYPLVRRVLTQITSQEPDDCSTLDYARYDGEGGDFPVEDGYGALVAANAAGLPVGLDTQAGQRGESLSAGERQLVALARAYLADPDLLVLDEATSAVDPATEVRIQRALDSLARGRTSIAIAHRISTAQAADEVLVMDAGRVVQRGPHARLVTEDGPYAALYASWVANQGAH